MIRRHRRADLVLGLAIGVGADIDAGHELDPVEVGEACDAARRLCLGRTVLVGNPPRGVQHASHEAAAHVRPIRPLGAVQADQGEDLAPGVRAFEDGELAVDVDRAARPSGRVAAGPALAGIVEAAGPDAHAHLGQRPLGNQRGVLLGVVIVVPGRCHGISSLCWRWWTAGPPPARRPARRRTGARKRDAGGRESSRTGGRGAAPPACRGDRCGPWRDSPRG